MFKWLMDKIRGKKKEDELKVTEDTEQTERRKMEAAREISSQIEQALRSSISELQQKVEEEKEARKRVEEKYDELRVEYERTKRRIQEKEEQVKKAEEKVKQVEKESIKLVKLVEKRYSKGQYIPVILWTERMNPMPYKFVVEVGWVNGGYRALLVDSPTDDPSTGEWFPSLDKPAPNFCFMDDPGFNPEDPSHTVLFAINRYDWEKDLQITANDPRVKPVALMFGIDLDGNPVHPLRYGAPINIRTLRAENRSLKFEIMGLRHRLYETEEKLKNTQYAYQMERDMREHLEQRLKELEAQLFELRQAQMLTADEVMAAREAWEIEKRRRLFATKRALHAEELFNTYFGRGVSDLPYSEFYERRAKERQSEVISLLAPIARIEAEQYGIKTEGVTNEELVRQWLKKKYEKENKDLAEILREYGLEDRVAEIIQGG